MSIRSSGQVDNSHAHYSPTDERHKPAYRPPTLLVLLGLATEIVYLISFALRFFLPDHYSTFTDLGGWTQYRPSAFVSFIVSILALFVLYWLAFSLSRKETGTATLPMVVGFGVLFALTMSLMYPVTATDIFGYIVRVRILTVHHANPFTALPSAFPQDPFFRYIGGWKDWPTPYGPLFVLLGAVPSFLGSDSLMLNLLLFKGLSLASYMGNIALLYVILRQSAPKMIVPAILFYAWNPLVLFEALGNGHNDVAMMFFVLLAFYLMVTNHREAAVVALVASILVKYITVLLLPLILLYALNSYPSWRTRLVFLARSLVASAILVVLVYSPFWQGRATLTGFLGQADIFISSLPTVIMLLLQQWFGTSASATVTKGLVGIAFLAIYLWLIKDLKRSFQQYMLVGAEILFAYLVVACAQFESWYVIWPITLAALAVQGRITEQVTALSFGALLSVALFAYVWPWTQAGFLTMNVAAVSLILLPPLVLWLFRSTTLWKANKADHGIRAI